jgi:hypothetical protein
LSCKKVTITLYVKTVDYKLYKNLALLLCINTILCAFLKGNFFDRTFVPETKRVIRL